MAMELDDNTIVMFPNGKKTEGDNQPNYRGEGMYKGVAFEVGVWKNVSKAGKTYMKGQLQAPYDGGSAGASDYPARDTVSDDVPF
jgi:uncharacterized protein (DUF736 family)|tara:strand:+ start:490 stop:744 length:255 start_codon:yes stop_codon:yes gene_type:complete